MTTGGLPRPAPWPGAAPSPDAPAGDAPAARPLPSAPAPPRPTTRPPSAPARPGAVLRLAMVKIPGGRFMMGSHEGERGASDDERPRREVHLSPFEMSRAPVTQRLYESVMRANPSRIEGDDLPIINVTWRGAVEFCNRLSALDGLSPAYQLDGESVIWLRGTNGYRLPTEAEWEHAARGADGRIYPWGDDPPGRQLCWNGPGNDEGQGSRIGPSPVGSYPDGASPFGLMDMAGNVLEWCWDWSGPYDPTPSALTDPIGPPEGAARILRGGSWTIDYPAGVRAAHRFRLAVSSRFDFVGFRCARGPAQT
ncbi:MAG: SUMF1/EgtB/PvdO family nonheme iron enzyme [Polyangiaceae bacterium]|nr:SUMF1/EgtB/PvdO family nonheme iron enzyme [Polyangiaceae bacterium]